MSIEAFQTMSVIEQADTETGKRKRSRIALALQSIHTLLRRPEWTKGGANAASTSKQIVRSLDEFGEGYPMLATFKDSDESYMMYRRFGYLQARLLLERQNDLSLLERELDDFDHEHRDQLFTAQPDPEVLEPRKELLDEIEKKFKDYASLLDVAHKMVTLRKPSTWEHRQMCNFIDNTKPIHRSERLYLLHKEDLISIRSRQERAWLDKSLDFAIGTFVERRQSLVVSRLLLNLFGADLDWARRKSGGMTNVYYSKMNMSVLGDLTATLAMVALLVVPIYILYRLATSDDGIFSGDALARSIATILVSTLLFLLVLWLFTKVKRHEMFGFAAAYCAVLVVFLGNVK